MHRDATAHGWLKHGNPPGDPTKAPRCGAQTRRHTACQAPAMANGRCRMHGGGSTGPRTLAGLARIRAAMTQHGRFSAAGMAFERWRRRYVANGYRSARAMPDPRMRAHFLMLAADELPSNLVESMRTTAWNDVARHDADRLAGRRPRTMPGDTPTATAGSDDQATRDRATKRDEAANRRALARLLRG
jgi:hypothetical protein